MAEQKNQELDRQLAAAPIDTIAKFKISKEEKQGIRDLVEEFAAPLEAKAFEAGKRAGLAEARGNSGNFDRERTAVAEKAALLVAHGTRTAATRDLSPVDLAKRAKQLQDAARAEGKELPSASAVRLAYEEAGFPTDEDEDDEDDEFKLPRPPLETKKQDDKKDDKKADSREQVAMAEKLAKEAKEFVATEEKAGRTVTTAEAMKHVYEKAGVPTR